MRRRFFAIVLCIGLLVLAGWLGRANQDKKKGTWAEVAPGVLRLTGPIAGYALVGGEKALLIDAPHGAGDLTKHGIRQIDGVLLTHYHRSVTSGLYDLPKAIKVQAPKKA